MSEAKVALTQYSHGAGCGCKIAPQVLEQILHTDNDYHEFQQLLIGNQAKDDAAVYDLGNDNLLIATTDFFMPIVDDAFDFGRAAAANAISDVYAMGGSPLMALAILGWPVEKLPALLAQQVLEGARATCKLAGIPLAGGHSIDSLEPIFGLSVNGMVSRQHLKQNNTAKNGDLLLLTKALGTGILSTAQKRGLLEPIYYQQLVDQLTTLNSIGKQLGAISGVEAMTDITGFGLLGHLVEMVSGSGLGATVYYEKLPLLPGVKELAAKRIIPDATFRNWNSHSNLVSFGKGINVMEAFNLLPDPQTNGGLLIAVSPQSLTEVQELFLKNGLESFLEPIGLLHEPSEKLVNVV